MFFLFHLNKNPYFHKYIIFKENAHNEHKRTQEFSETHTDLDDASKIVEGSEKRVESGHFERLQIQSAANAIELFSQGSHYAPTLMYAAPSRNSSFDGFLIKSKSSFSRRCKTD